WGPRGNSGSWGPCVLAQTQKSLSKRIFYGYKNGCKHAQAFPLDESLKLGAGADCQLMGGRAIGEHGAPVSLPKLKKAYEKGTRGISWGPLLTPGPRAVPEFPNGQSAP
ncbi:unnamed protein product, partial [Staurois parvus]